MFFSEVKSRADEDISILVRLANHPWTYICECGDASDLTIKEIRSCKAIFISHTHIDHFVNFDTILRHQIGGERKVIICGPQGIAQHVESKIKSYTWNLIKAGAIIYEIREIVSDEKIMIYKIAPPNWELIYLREETSNIIYKDESLEVTSILLDHKTPTLSYRFKEKDKLKINLRTSGFEGGKWVRELKEAFEKGEKEQHIIIGEKTYKAEELEYLLEIKKGDTVGVIMDHAAHKKNHEKIKSHFHGCRKVFIESFYKETEKEYAELNHHSYSTMSGKIMKESQIKEAIPVHFSRKYNAVELEELKAEFYNAYKG